MYYYASFLYQLKYTNASKMTGVMSSWLLNCFCCRCALHNHTTWITPCHSSRQHLSYDDCMEDKREDYQDCSVLYCVPQLYPVLCTLICAVLTGILGCVGLGFQLFVAIMFVIWLVFSFFVYDFVVVWFSVSVQSVAWIVSSLKWCIWCRVGC